MFLKLFTEDVDFLNKFTFNFFNFRLYYNSASSV